MNRSFNDLGIIPPILKAIEEMGFEKPTEVQSKAIPHILNHEDLIVMSKTGSGKTAVFGVSMLQMTDPAEAAPLGLILTPTRELAVQVDSDLKKMGKYLQHKTTAVYGQHSMNVEVQALNKGVSIVTGTPGRVFDHIQHGTLKTKNIRFLVLDEADRMLDMGFIDQVVKIIRTLPRDRMTLLFSATIPYEVKRICTDYMKNPVTIEIESQTKTVDTIEQAYYRTEPQEKQRWLYRLLLMERPESCMIFCNTKHAVDRVQRFLTQKGLACHALHGDIPQTRRLKTIDMFKRGDFRLLVATDVAARGIHIEGLSLVINYDIPQDKDSYVHRIGRTGRAGNAGKAISLVIGDDIMSLYEIEEHIGAMISEAELPSDNDFNEIKTEADKWIKENELKVHTAPAATVRRTSTAGEKRGPADASHERRRTAAPSSAKQNDTQNHVKPRTPSRNPNNSNSRVQTQLAYDNRAAVKDGTNAFSKQNPAPRTEATGNGNYGARIRSNNMGTGAPGIKQPDRVQGTQTVKSGSSVSKPSAVLASKSGLQQSNAKEGAGAQNGAPKKSLLKRMFESILGKRD